MNNDEGNENNEPKTAEEAFWFITYHLGAFLLKCAFIVTLWLGIVHYLEKWLLK